MNDPRSLRRAVLNKYYLVGEAFFGEGGFFVGGCLRCCAGWRFSPILVVVLSGRIIDICIVVENGTKEFY